MIGPLTERLDRTWLLARKKALCAVSAPRPPRGRVFVGGMQRSGTNLLMDVLERSFETDVFHEWDPRAFDNYRMREPAVIARLIAESRAPSFVIKALCELPRLPALMETFAPAKTVWIVRRYEDVVNSMLISFGNMAKQVRRIAGDRDSSGWLGEGMSDATHAVVRRLVHEEIDNASASALQWYFRNILFFELGFPHDARVLLVQYEQLVREPRREVERLFEFLGLDYSPRCVRRISARSVKRRPPPPIEPPVREVCDELWARFETALAEARREAA